MHVFDEFDFGIALQDDRIKTTLFTHHYKCRIQTTQRLNRGIRAHVLVMIKHHPAYMILNGCNRPIEPALLPGVRRPLLACHRVGVQIFPREAVLGCDQISTDTLGSKIGFIGNLRVRGPGTAVRHHRYAGHGFNSTADGHIRLARHDLRCRGIHRFQSGCTEAVELLAGYIFRVIRIEYGNTRNIRALLTHRCHATQNYVVYQRSIQIVAVAQCSQDLAGQVNRCNRMQRAIGFTATARGAHMVVNICFSHFISF